MVQIRVGARIQSYQNERLRFSMLFRLIKLMLFYLPKQSCTYRKLYSPIYREAMSHNQFLTMVQYKKKLRSTSWKNQSSDHERRRPTQAHAGLLHA